MADTAFARRLCSLPGSEQMFAVVAQEAFALHGQDDMEIAAG